MSLYNGLDEFGNNAPRKIWHQGEGGALKRTLKHAQIRLDESGPSRDTLRAEALTCGFLLGASVIIDGKHRKRDLFNVAYGLEQRPKRLYATVGSGQPNGGLRVRVDERRTDGLIWRPV